MQVRQYQHKWFLSALNDIDTSSTTLIESQWRAVGQVEKSN